MIIGTMLAINHIMPLLNKKLLIKSTGELDTEGSSVVFLGGDLTRIGETLSSSDLNTITLRNNSQTLA